jgi:hypothetical protein
MIDKVRNGAFDLFLLFDGQIKSYECFKVSTKQKMTEKRRENLNTKKNALGNLTEALQCCLSRQFDNDPLMFVIVGVLIETAHKIICCRSLDIRYYDHHGTKQTRAWSLPKVDQSHPGLQVAPTRPPAKWQHRPQHEAKGTLGVQCRIPEVLSGIVPRRFQP